jgi:LmbE family N-acetylglucosaminyl deacetylase
MATIVVFHAHPDDEVLLTGGTIASGAIPVVPLPP